jgi:hypothetical protein
MEGVLNHNVYQSKLEIHGEIKRLTGAPGLPPGMLISITLLGGKVYTLPEGSKSCAV